MQNIDELEIEEIKEALTSEDYFKILEMFLELMKKERNLLQVVPQILFLLETSANHHIRNYCLQMLFYGNETNFSYHFCKAIIKNNGIQILEQLYKKKMGLDEKIYSNIICRLSYPKFVELFYRYERISIIFSLISQFEDWEYCRLGIFLDKFKTIFYQVSSREQQLIINGITDILRKYESSDDNLAECRDLLRVISYKISIDSFITQDFLDVLIKCIDENKFKISIDLQYFKLINGLIVPLTPKVVYLSQKYYKQIASLMVKKLIEIVEFPRKSLENQGIFDRKLIFIMSFQLNYFSQVFQYGSDEQLEFIPSIEGISKFLKELIQMKTFGPNFNQYFAEKIVNNENCRDITKLKMIQFFEKFYGKKQNETIYKIQQLKKLKN